MILRAPMGWGRNRQGEIVLDPKDIAQFIERLGTAGNGFARIEESYAKFQTLWSQNAEKVGRVLFAHLAVDYFLTKFIQWANPRLGSLADARLTFGQKIELIGDGDQLLSWLKPGLRTLDDIRGRISQQLSVQIDERERASFLDTEIFAALRSSVRHDAADDRDDAVTVLEEFSEFAASVLHNCCHAGADDWRGAAWSGAGSGRSQ